MHNDSPVEVIESTIDHLSSTRKYVEAFRKEMVEAFEANAISCEQFYYMKDRVESFIKRLDLYEGMFMNMKDACSAVGEMDAAV